MKIIEVLGADVGGTFTDVIVEHPDGSTAALKLPSTRSAYDDAILAAAEELAPGAAIRRLAHGTTVATNALLERKGARTALITTEGFRDVLELARLRRPSLFDLTFVKPLPLVPRDRRLEIRERTAADGTCLFAPTRDQVDRVVADLVASEVQAVAVCLLNAHANPHNEQLVRDWVTDGLRERGCPAVVTASSDIQREIREFERTSTVVINSYVAPIVSHYLDRLRERIERQHGTDIVQIMQSNGSLIPGGLAARFPCRLIESGPAAGVLAAADLVADVNDGDAIAFDMGGTTAKAALIEGGHPFETVQLEVGSAMNRDGASMSGSGYVIRAPSLDISEVGAGGGSIIWLDRTGAPRVGPESAGAEPGPACYGRGGVEPTVTDANLILGFLSPAAIAGGRVTLRRDLAEKALTDRIAVPLGVDLVTAAWGVHSLANVGMEAALRAVSVERGRSPARYVLVGYGGAGPMHAAMMAASFGMTTVVIPPRPGLLCAAGLLSASIRHDAVVAYPSGVSMDATTLRQCLAEARSSLERLLADDLPEEANVVMTWRLAVRYVGQPGELLVALDPEADLADETGLAALVRSRFMAEHERTYGYADAYAPMEVVSLRGAASGRADAGRADGGSGHDTSRRAARADTPPAEPTERRAYFGPTQGWLTTPVHRSRRAMSGCSGPLLLEEPDSTTVVPPGWAVVCDERDRLLLNREAP